MQKLLCTFVYYQIQTYLGRLYVGEFPAEMIDRIDLLLCEF